MYEENANMAAVGAQMNLVTAQREDRTIGENIDARIADMEREIATLKEIKEKLGREVSLVDMKPSELRRAINC